MNGEYDELWCEKHENWCENYERNGINHTQYGDKIEQNKSIIMTNCCWRNGIACVQSESLNAQIEYGGDK